MNAADCDHIGYLIVEYANGLSEDLKEALFAMDPRIEENFEGYNYVQARREQVRALFKTKIVERFGEAWSVMNACTKEIRVKVLAEAGREVYGEDYDPKLHGNG